MRSPNLACTCTVAIALAACGVPTPAGSAASAATPATHASTRPERTERAERADASADAPLPETADRDAGPPAAPCGPPPSTGSGALSIRDVGGRLWLGFEGPTESTTGRAYAMDLRVAGKVLAVTIAASSKPTDPRGVTLDAEGTNGGSVALPEELSGAWELSLRQGAARATYDLAVTPDDVTVTPRAVPPSSLLRFGASRVRRRTCPATP